jgi:hypothetical protein
MRNFNTRAERFAEKHGPFILDFDLTRPAKDQWMVFLKEDDRVPDHASIRAYTRGYSGFTVVEALAFADTELCLPPGP